MLELSLPEALVVLGIEADRGTTRDRLTLSYAIGGGQLAELKLAGRICVDDEQVVVISDAATGDEHLDELLAKFAGADRPYTPGHWVMKRRSAGLAEIQSALADPAARSRRDAALIALLHASAIARRLIGDDEQRERAADIAEQDVIARAVKRAVDAVQAAAPS